MDRIFSCIDGYLKDLEGEVLKILEDQSTPMTRKNQLMEPIADQKKILIYTKEALLSVKNKEYIAGCGMSKLREDNDDK